MRLKISCMRFLGRRAQEFQAVAFLELNGPFVCLRPHGKRSGRVLLEPTGDVKKKKKKKKTSTSGSKGSQKGLFSSDANMRLSRVVIPMAHPTLTLPIPTPETHGLAGLAGSRSAASCHMFQRLWVLCTHKTSPHRSPTCAFRSHLSASLFRAVGNGIHFCDTTETASQRLFG